VFCAAGKHFSYVICEENGVKSYHSFGLGDNYVLGNEGDDSEFTPYQVDKEVVLKNENIV